MNNSLYSDMDLLTPVERMQLHTNVRNLQIARSHINRIAATNVTRDNGLGELGKLSREEKIALKKQRRIEKAARRALNKLMSKKQRRRLAKQARKAQKQLRKSIIGDATGGRGFIAELNKPGAARLPLSPIAEQFRVASVAGDFVTMNAIAPFGPRAWLKKTSLGKYRFELQNGRLIYLPWSDQDIDLFLAGPWLVRNPATGQAPLIHPRRTRRSDFVKRSIDYKNAQRKVAQRFPASNARHVVAITPGAYIFKSGLKSRWVKIRKSVLIAGAIVAAVYLGPQVVAKIKGMGAPASVAEGAAAEAATGAASGAATGGIATSAGTSAKIFAGAQQLTEQINQARTINAIVNGEMPPPPIGVSGNSFREWAFNVAKDEFIKDAQRQMTQSEEIQLQREIAQMQSELERLIPANTAMQPSAGVPLAVQKTMLEQKKNSEELNQILMIAVPVGIGLFMLGG